MPAADRILSWAATVANDWRWLAIAWHVALAALLIAFVTLPRPSRRLLGLVLAVPITSVGLVAWASGNPFNSVAFSVLAVVLFRTAVRLPRAPAGRVMAGCRLAGAGLVAFGWAYPHFLRTDTWTAYLYASPFGLLPCPTLSVVIGITLMFGGLSAGWSLPLSAAGGLYGLIGVFVLGVALDAWLFAGAGLLGITTGVQMFAARVRATDEERGRRIPDAAKRATGR